MKVSSKQSTSLFLLIFCITKSFCYIESNISFCPEIEKQALLTFKISLKNPSNPLISSWNTSSINCCKWKGVVCSNFTGHVHQIHLRSRDDSQYLHGKVNLSHLLHLKELKYLDLSQNQFQGRIPSFIGSFGKLEYLNLSHAGFHGKIPHDIGNLSNLHTLIIEGSYLNVDGLAWLSGLVHLKHLNMNFVDFKKERFWLKIINTLPSLTELHLSGCRLEFLSPLSSLSHVNVTSLALLDLSRNELGSFEITRWIFRQTNLIFLDLSHNFLEGPLPITSNFTKIQHLDLSWNKFTSTIPDWIYSCRDLKFLFLGFNSIQGTISKSIANLTILDTLSLRGNELSENIPPEIANLCNLRRLDLSHNNLEGEISDSFGNMSPCFLRSLIVWRLRQNKLSGHLTDQFGEFKRLRYLDFTKNSISGKIPSNLGKLSRLRILWLGFNKLSGDFPMSLGQLSNLKSLSIGRNMLEGIVNETHFSNLTKLKYLFASGNNLTLKVGRDWIPPFQLEEIGLGSWNFETVPKIPSWIHGQRSTLSVLDLSDAGLNGNVPSWVWGISVLNLSHNQFHGEVPDFEPRTNHLVFPHFRLIYLSSNKFSGSLPRVSYDLMELDLSSNSFSGNLSHFLCDDVKDIESYGLRILHLADNVLTGEIPDCWAKWSLLKYLNLGNNMMFGSIPNSIGFLDNLLSLNLNGNRFSGQIPLSLHRCTKLVKIDLGGNALVGKLPKWIGTSLANLMILILRSNKFDGNIPSTICHLSSLQILDLSNNNFLGDIPVCLHNLTAMSDLNLERNGGKGIEYSRVFDAFLESVLVDTKGLLLEYHTFLVLVTNINLSNNNLSGEIPEGVTSLVELKSLNLARNDLRGSIPRRIGDMRQLESLDLSRNSLSGEIPISITVLSFLSYLNLSHNFLKGKIPGSTQLSSMDASSFVGNDLCGPPLTVSCDEGVRPLYEENDEDEDDEVDWFYVLVVLGYVVGFAVVCSTLVLHKSWREAYFGWLEQVWDKICVYFTIKWLRMKDSFRSKCV